MTDKRQTGQVTPVPDNNLTPEQYDKLTPLLKLASIGSTDLLDHHKPAQLRRQEKKDRAITALRQYGTLERAAEAAGVSRATVYRWREADPAFEAQVKQWIEEDMEDELHDTLFTIAKKGKEDAKYASAAVKAAELLIKAENREKYGDQIKQETTVTVNHQVQVVTSYRDKQRAALQSINRQALTIDAE